MSDSNATHVAKEEHALDPKQVILEHIAPPLKRLAANLDGLSHTGSKMPLLIREMSKERRAFEALRDKYDTGRRQVVQEGGVSSSYRTIRIPIEDLGAWKKAQKLSLSSHYPPAFMSSGLLIQAYAYFEVYVQDMANAILNSRPETLSRLDLQVDLHEVATWTDFSAKRQDLIARKLDNFLFGSYEDVLSRLFSLAGEKPVTTECAEWNDFYEGSQRRHVFVHAGGRVTPKYVESCLKEGVYSSDNCPQVADHLKVEPQYFRRLLIVIESIAWRTSSYLTCKLHGAKGEEIISDLYNERIFECLEHENWPLAEHLSELFLQTLAAKSKAIPERSKRMAIVNHAQAIKWLGKVEDAIKVIEKHDWSSQASDFVLALMAIKDDYRGIADNLGSKTDKNWHGILQWPLYREFRKSQDFHKKYKKVFKRTFASPDELEPQSKDDLSATD